MLDYMLFIYFENELGRHAGVTWFGCCPQIQRTRICSDSQVIISTVSAPTFSPSHLVLEIYNKILLSSVIILLTTPPVQLPLMDLYTLQPHSNIAGTP